MGMPEYHDGTMGPIKPVNESLRDLLNNPTEQARTKALHIGQFDELAERAKQIGESEPLAKMLQTELYHLRMDVNTILIHLGLDDKNTVLGVREIPHKPPRIPGDNPQG